MTRALLHILGACLQLGAAAGFLTPEPDSSFKAFTNYAEITGFLAQTGARASPTVRITDAYELFPSIRAPLCGTAKCKFPIVELCNNSLGETRIRNLPTLILATGFRTADLEGISIALNLIRAVDSLAYLTNPDMAYLLNNYRLILLPLSNPNGVYYQRDTEELTEGMYVDVLSDFPAGPGDDLGSASLLSSAAQIWARIFSNYVVLGTMILHQGDYEISYTVSGFGGGADALVNEALAKRLSQWSATYLERFSTHFPYSQALGDEAAVSRFAAWAGNNGSLVLSLSTGKRQAAAAFQQSLLGSIGSLFGTTTPARGIHTFIVEALMQFAYFFAPKVRLNVPSVSAKGSELSFELDIQGCIIIDQLALMSGQRHSIEPMESSELDLSARFRVTLELEEDAGHNEAAFRMNCDTRWTSIVRPSAGARSHYLRSKLDPNYSVERPWGALTTSKDISLTITDLKIAMSPRDIYAFAPYDRLITLASLKAIEDAKVDFSSKLQALQIMGDYYRSKATQFQYTEQSQSLSMTEFNDVGLGVQAVAGRPLGLTFASAAAVLQLSAFSYLSLVGKSLRLPSSEQRDWSVQIANPKGTRGLPMPPSGCVCSSGTESEWTSSPFYYYLALRPLEADLLSVELLIEREGRYTIEVLGQHARLSQHATYSVRSGQRIWSYRAVLDPNFPAPSQSDIRHHLLGGRALIVAEGEGQWAIECRLQSKNPRHDESAHIIFGFQTQVAYGSSGTGSVPVIAAVFLSTVALLAGLLALASFRMARAIKIRRQPTN